MRAIPLAQIGFALMVCLLPIAQTALGWTVARRFFRTERGDSVSIVVRAGSFLLGLLLHLFAMYGLRSAGVAWSIALAIPLLPAVFDKHAFQIVEFAEPPRFSVNFLAWLSVTLVLGISVFSPVAGIQTVWANNYGDLPFHIGMISSFAFGDNFPAQYHIYPGLFLSYPFFVNLWSASLWWFIPSPFALKLIFLMQWMVLWTVVYKALDGDRNTFIPWAALFGGGTYHFIAAHIFENVGAKAYTAQAHELISSGAPWTPFLSTIWVTQRTALFGAAVVLTAVRLFHDSQAAGYLSSTGARARLMLAGLLLGLAPLVHTHLFLVGAFYVAAIVGTDCIRKFFTSRGHEFEPACRVAGLAAVTLSPALIVLWLISGKSSMMSLTAGWIPTDEQNLAGLQHAGKAARMWLSNGFPWFAAIAYFGVVTKRWGLVALFAAMFLLANTVQLAVWDWDQIKVFLAIYLVFLSAWSFYAPRLPFGKQVFTSVAFGLLLTLPALIETLRVAVNYPSSGVFTEEQLQLARSIRGVTKPHDIIAANPLHNSTVILTGRPFFMGYDGTLYSHNIGYQVREALNKSPEKLIACDELICPDYLLWGNSEREYWKDFNPLGNPNLETTIVPGLFRIKAVGK